MNKALTLSKLEALLSRIRTRSTEPRRSPSPRVAAAPAGVAPAAPTVPVAAVPAPAALAAPTAVASVAPVIREATIPVASPPPEAITDESTLPPPPPTLMGADQEFAVEVDLSEATDDPLDAREASAEEHDSRGPFDSQERLAVAESTPPQSLSSAEVEPSVEPVEVLADDESLAAHEEDEVEEAPVSSRRAVVSPPEERLAQLAFGSDEPPQRHTPPPKSGPLLAPPMGEFEADTTGIRKTETISADDASLSLAPRVLVPQATRPNLASSANVVDVIGEAQAFEPATFIALLDASLAL